MGLFPIAMNIIQFWLIDSIVKATSQEMEPRSSPSPRLSADREPLFSANASEDGSTDEGCSELRVHDIENPEVLHSRSHSIEIKTSVVGEDFKPSSPRRPQKASANLDEHHEYPPSSLDSSSSGRSVRSRSTTPRLQRFTDLRQSDDVEISSSLGHLEVENEDQLRSERSTGSPTNAFDVQSPQQEQEAKRTKSR